MVLSPESIKTLHIITPFWERYKLNGVTGGAGYGGYDIAVDQQILVKAGKFTLGSSLERFKVPTYIIGVTHDKSTFARQGLSVFNTIIEPGWEGYLTLEFANHSDKDILIKAGTPIAQVIFHTLDKASKGYEGKYQNQLNEPIGAIFDE